MLKGLLVEGNMFKGYGRIENINLGFFNEVNICGVVYPCSRRIKIDLEEGNFKWCS